MPVCRAKTPIRMITATSKNQTTMKRLFNSIMAVATIAAAITACTKEDVSNIGTPAEFKIAVTAEADATRTYYDEAQKQMNWNASGEKLKVLEYNKSEWDFKAYTTSGYELDGRSAKFSVSVYGSASSEGFMYSAIYPAANYIEFSNSSRKAFKIQVPSAQTPAESSFDPNADLLLAKPIDLAERPSELTFQFHRVAALAKMTLKGIAAGEKIEKIELAASQPLAGVLVADLSTGKLTDAAVADGKGLTLTINDFVATGEDAVWFTALPCTLGADDTLTITVDTDKATYEKTAVFTADKPFALESANITAFGITEMKRSEKAQAKTYTKLTDVSLLNADDQLILVYNSNGTNYALAKKLYSDGSFDKTAVTVTNNQIGTIGENVEIITLHDGKTEGTFLFELSDGSYLNISGYKFEKTDVASADSWQIIFGSYGKITVKDVTTTSSYNGIKYDDDEVLGFICDSPNSYYTYDITAIYHCAIGTPKTALATPANLAATAAGNVVTVTWSAVEGATDYTVTCGGESKTSTETTAEFTLEYDKSYEISVVANPADTSVHKVSAAATTSVTTEKDPAGEVSGGDKEETLVFPIDGATSGKIGTIEGTNFTLSSSNAEWHSEGLGLKMSNGNTITFRPTNGKTITKIEITAATGKYFKARASEGSLENNQGAGATSVWTGSAAVSVTFTATGFSIIGQVKVTCE